MNIATKRRRTAIIDSDDELEVTTRYNIWALAYHDPLQPQDTTG